MNVRLKYKVFDKRDSKLKEVEGYTFSLMKFDDLVAIQWANGLYEGAIPLEDLIFCQCTGLKDCNGKLIFEGDILNVNTGSRDTSGIGEVVYLQCGCNFVLNGFLENPSGYYPRRKGEFHIDLQEWLCTEVIGNIYTTPELLEGKE